MTKKQILQAALDYFNVATFPAWAGESCRCCPKAPKYEGIVNPFSGK
jgi:hypothetical protein